MGRWPWHFGGQHGEDRSEAWAKLSVWDRLATEACFIYCLNVCFRSHIPELEPQGSRQSLLEMTRSGRLYVREWKPCCTKSLEKTIWDLLFFVFLGGTEFIYDVLPYEDSERSHAICEEGDPQRHQFFWHLTHELGSANLTKHNYMLRCVMQSRTL